VSRKQASFSAFNSKKRMKTSVIRYRVADFLREHPPFDLFSLEDLLAFSGTGRVIFHEDDIQVFQKGQPRDPLLWVIQQGRIEIIDETPLGAQLRDVLGPGDILGLTRAQDAGHSHTARTATEVILYSFDSAAFETLVSKYPEAARYLTAHLSATSRHTKALQAPANRERLLTEREKASWLNAAPLPPTFSRRRLVTCGPELPIREAVKLMAQARSEAVVVIGANAHPLGLITDQELRALATIGATSPDSPSDTLMNRSFQTAPPGLRAADYLLEMIRGRCQTLVITADGTAEAALEGVITDSDLAVNCSRNPALFIREMLAAETVEELSYLRQRAETFLAEELIGPTTVEWFWHMLGKLNAALIERVAQIAEAEMARAGRPNPGLQCCLQSCWLLFGPAGRCEVLMPDAPALGIVYADPSQESNEETRKYFSTLAQKVVAKLQACGLRPRQNQIGVSQGAFCRSLSELKDFYSGLIRDPIGNAIYTARDFFDFHVVYGDPASGSELKKIILAELKLNEAFIPVLANDTLANLPPLTFFQGAVIESDGARKQTLDIEKTALNPIVDAARVFALAAGEVSIPNTLRRLESAARAMPLRASVFNDAADGLRIASYQHAVARFREKSEDAIIQTSRLSRFDQRLLKSAFDSVRRLLELTSATYNSIEPQ
jgi:CBS domain-containing protein